jgi:hypothetical protein
VPEAAVPFWTHWYELAAFDNLRQGDILRGLTVLWFPQGLTVDEAKVATRENIEVEPDYKKDDWIVLTASCDMENNPNAQVLLGRVFEANQANLKAPNDAQFKERLEVLKRGQYPNRHLLAEFEDGAFRFPQSVVDFHFHALMPIQYLLRAAASPRLRMKSPFREQFGNWAGGCISRVGPETSMQIPKIVEHLWDKQILRATADQAPGGPVSDELPKIDQPSQKAKGPA